MPLYRTRHNVSRTYPGAFRAETARETTQRHPARHQRPVCSRSCCGPRHGLARQSNRELGELADLAIDLYRAAVLLGYNVVADREPQTSAFPGRLGREEWLKQLVPNLRRNPDTVITRPDLHRIAEVPGRHFQYR